VEIDFSINGIGECSPYCPNGKRCKVYSGECSEICEHFQGHTEIGKQLCNSIFDEEDVELPTNGTVFCKFGEY
jgi:hypothetical protein